MKKRFLLSLLVFILFSYKSDSKIPLEIFGKFDHNQASSSSETKEDLIAGERNVEQNNGNFNKLISNVRGDLNNDGIADLITVRQDTVNEKKSYRLQIYLSQADKKLKLFLSSDSAIVAKFPDGNNSFSSTTLFTGIKINKGTFLINHELIRGSFSHQFRFQNNKFELIDYRSAGASGRDVEEIDFNLSTGNKITKLTPIGGDNVKSTQKSKQLIRPLPNLKFFEPYNYQY